METTKHELRGPFKILPHRAEVTFSDKDGLKRAIGSTFTTQVDAERAQHLVEFALRLYKGQV